MELLATDLSARTGIMVNCVCPRVELTGKLCR